MNHKEKLHDETSGLFRTIDRGSDLAGPSTPHATRFDKKYHPGSSGEEHRGCTADDSDINPEAISALNSMGTYLRTLKTYQVEAVTTKDDVLDDCELIPN